MVRSSGSALNSSHYSAKGIEDCIVLRRTTPQEPRLDRSAQIAQMRRAVRRKNYSSMLGLQNLRQSPEYWWALSAMPQQIGQAKHFPLQYRQHQERLWEHLRPLPIQIGKTRMQL